MHYYTITCGRCRVELGWSYRRVASEFNEYGDPIQDVLCDACYAVELT